MPPLVIFVSSTLIPSRDKLHSVLSKRRTIQESELGWPEGDVGLAGLIYPLLSTSPFLQNGT